MLVSHTKRFIYLKTVKTAGTSVEMALQPYCMPEGVAVTEWLDSMETDAGIVGARGPGAAGQPWWNHMPAAKLRDRLPRDVWNGYYKICNIRNPWDKTVSFFHMIDRDIKDESPDTIVGRFRHWLHEVDGIGRDTAIYFIDGSPVADAYIRYENLHDDLARVCARLGLQACDLPHAKAHMRGANRIPYQAYYDPPARQIVAAQYALEIGHFGWTFD